MQHGCLELRHPGEYRIVCDHPGRTLADCRRRLQRIGSAQAMLRSKLRGEIRQLQIGCNPPQVGISRKQTVESIDLVFIFLPIRRHQKLRHRNGGRHGLVPAAFHPGKNRICQRKISWICFQLVNEYAGVDSDSTVPPQVSSKLFYSQLSRSTFKCWGVYAALPSPRIAFPWDSGFCSTSTLLPRTTTKTLSPALKPSASRASRGITI